MTDERFWAIVSTVDWEHAHDYEVIKKWFLANMTQEETNAFREVLNLKWIALDLVVGDGRNPTHGGEDSYGDLLHHIIGLGQERYEAHLNDYALIEKRGHAKHGTPESYVECFSYAIPDEEDWKYNNNDSHIYKWANKAITEIQDLLDMDKDRNDLAPIMKDFLFVIEQLDLLPEGKYQSFMDNKGLTCKHLDKIAKFFKDNYLELPRKFTNNGHNGYNEWYVKNLYSDIEMYILKD